MIDEPEVMCQVCNCQEVNHPALDWCIACDRKMCDDCKAAGARDDEHGCYWCQDCAERERADWASQEGL